MKKGNNKFNIKSTDIMLVNLPYPIKYLAADAMEDYRGGHLGQGYLAATLEENGIPCELYDCPRMGIDYNQLLNIIKENKPLVIGFHFYHINVHILYRLLVILKGLKPKPLIVLGGRQATSTADSILKSNSAVDCVILSEGEITLLNIVTKYLEKKYWKNEDGIAYLGENNEVIYTEPRELVSDLDTLPFPKRIFFPNQKRAGLCTTRGCYGNCAFCSMCQFYDYAKGQRFRTRSPENVVDEIDMLYKKGVEFIMIDSDNFLMSDRLNPGWINEFSSLIVERDIHIRFQIYARSDDITAERISRLKEVGLHCVFLGVESGIQERLKAFNKAIKVEDSIEAVRLLHSMGVKLKIGHIVFDPYSRLSDLLKEIEFLRKINFKETGAYLAEPFSIRFPLSIYPGTKIHDRLKEQNLLSNDTEYGFSFIDNSMYIYLDKIAKWQKMLRLLTWNYTKYYYYVEDIKDDILFDEMTKVISDIIALDMNVIERLIKQIIEEGEKAEISSDEYSQLECCLNEMKVLSERVEYKA